jgi:diamine N-acetyltransferase
MEAKIRRATAEDYQALCQLFDKVDALHRRYLPQIFEKPSGAVREREYYDELISDEKVGLFVAQRDSQLVGFIHACIRDARAIPILIPRRYAIIENLGVKSEFRHQGIGRTLVDTAHEWAIAKGATAIELNVHEFNKDAIAFYTKLGYRTQSRKMGTALKGRK